MSSRGLAHVLIWSLALIGSACCPKVRYKAKVNEVLKLRIQASADMARAEALAFEATEGGAGGRKRPDADEGQAKGSSKGEELPDIGLNRNELENLVERATKRIDPVTADEVLEAIRDELGPTPEEAESEAVTPESEDEPGDEPGDEPEDE